MEVAILALHLMVVIAMVGLILIQKSEGGGLGIGGGGGGGGNFMSARGTANLLTRATSILAVVFFCTSLLLTVLNNPGATAPSVFDTLQNEGGEIPDLNDVLQDLDRTPQIDGPLIPQSQ